MLKRVLQPLKTLHRQKLRGLCQKSAQRVMRMLKLVLQVLIGLGRTPIRPPQPMRLREHRVPCQPMMLAVIHGALAPPFMSSLMRRCRQSAMHAQGVSKRNRASATPATHRYAQTARYLEILLRLCRISTC